jgi:hypothetical protein
MKRIHLRTDERGIALVTALLVTLLISGLIAGAFAAISADDRSGAIDRDQTQVYAAAHAGLEKLTSDLHRKFEDDVSPSPDELLELANHPPELDGFKYIAPGDDEDGSGYSICWNEDPCVTNADPVATNKTISAGMFEGLQGMFTPYTVTVTARSEGGAEVRLRRELQTVAVPVFQYGVFSETPLTFFSGSNMTFNGRVHTNSHLYLNGALSGSSLLFKDRITAVGEVVRTHFANGQSISSNGFTGNVNIFTVATTSGSPVNMKYSPNQGSVAWPFNADLAVPNSTPGVSGWVNISKNVYKGFIRNWRTGVTKLDLPIVGDGAQPIDLIRRPVNDEDIDRPNVYNQRYFTQASLRILLSDRDTDITQLPGLDTTVAPVRLDAAGLAAAGYVVDATHPPIAASVGGLPVAPTVLSVTGSSNGNYVINLTTSGSPPPFPNEFKIANAAGTVNHVTVNGLDVTCLGRNANNLTNCTGITSAIPSGRTIDRRVPFHGLPTITTPVTASLVSSGATTIPVLGGTSTTFGAIQFWLHNNSTSQFVTCTGYVSSGSTQQFTGCGWFTGAAPISGMYLTTQMLSRRDESLIGGFIKIERKDADGDWNDVTMEILNLGFGDRNQEGVDCGDPTDDAVLRIQRLRDHGFTTTSCSYGQSRNPYDWWPNALFDAREGNRRSKTAGDPMLLGGVMNYITLDVANLTRWFNGDIGTTGDETFKQGGKDDEGYIVYFSDRRGNHNGDNATTSAIEKAAPGEETGEYGFEDTVNPASATGTPNGGTTPDAGEDVDGDGRLDRYGEEPYSDTMIAVPITLPASGGSTYPAAAKPYGDTNFPYSMAGRPGMAIVRAGEARMNRQVLFRRALKLEKGAIVGGVNPLPEGGLTVVAENPVYVQGNYNSGDNPNSDPDNDSTQPNVPTAIIADAVTLLSRSWTDANSFRNPNNYTSRVASTTGYRFAVIAGKSLSFPKPTVGSPNFLFGTDGGVANFFRALEDWTGRSVNWRGSIVSLYTSRQATGNFRYDTSGDVYDFSTRNFAFDDDFKVPNLLPPGTPMFRTTNTLKFRQILRPNQ